MQSLDRIMGYAHVAARYGLEEAIFLDSIMYWWRENRANGRNYKDGRWWTYNSVRAFADLLPWWSPKQIRRIIDSCRDKGAILAGDYNSDRRDRTLWYTPSDELLDLYGIQDTADNAGRCNRPNGQAGCTEGASSPAQTGEPLPCSNHVDNTIPPIVPPEGDGAQKRSKRTARSKATPDWKPDRFAKFWAYYPRGEAKQRAIQAWDRLRPSDELIDTMAAALQCQKQRKDWLEGIGIPYASTWLNGRRWEDEIRESVATPASGSCWADDPEVI